MERPKDGQIVHAGKFYEVVWRDADGPRPDRYAIEMIGAPATGRTWCTRLAAAISTVEVLDRGWARHTEAEEAVPEAP